MRHRCHAPSCSTTVSHKVFMCARHWRMIPRQLQADLRDAWNDQATDRHRGFAAEAVRLVGATEGGRSILGIVPGTKALTIWQPWASLIMMGAKPYEFRRWNFADKPHLAKLIGQRIVIHAGARRPRTEELCDIIERIDADESALDPKIARPAVHDLLAAVTQKSASLPAPLAAAIGTVTLGEPQRAADLFVDKVADSDRLDQHMYAWPMIDPQPFAAPVPASGAQGFWNWS